MKIVLQSETGKGIGDFIWNVPSPIEQAKVALESYGREQAPEKTDAAITALVTDIQNKITFLLWTISAAYALGGQEGVVMLKSIDETLIALQKRAEELMAQKFGNV